MIISPAETLTHDMTKHESNVPKAYKTTYTGDNTQNRAFTHGLGAIPRIILITGDEAGFAGSIIINGRQLRINDANAMAVTPATATTLYVGGAGGANGNANPSSYTLEAIL